MSAHCLEGVSEESSTTIFYAVPQFESNAESRPSMMEAVEKDEPGKGELNNFHSTEKQDGASQTLESGERDLLSMSPNAEYNSDRIHTNKGTCEPHYHSSTPSIHENEIRTAMRRQRSQASEDATVGGKYRDRIDCLPHEANVLKYAMFSLYHTGARRLPRVMKDRDAIFTFLPSSNIFKHEKFDGYLCKLLSDGYESGLT